MKNKIHGHEFYSLTPERVLDAVESFGFRCTGRALPLNSVENRVYEVEVESEERFIIVKFYRPNRWSADQIIEEHEYLLELQNEELPVVAPIIDNAGSTLKYVSSINCNVAIFPKRSGRLELESTPEDLQRLGRLMARVHQVGSRKEFKHRRLLSSSWYIRHNYLEVLKFIPEELKAQYDNILEKVEDSWSKLPTFPSLRLHGDCHRGNILWRPEEGPLLVDFDDSLQGPMIQDVWLLFANRLTDVEEELQHFISGYEVFQEFDDRQLKLVELLRIARMIQYAGWIARRWEDPSFKHLFPQFANDGYWQAHIHDLKMQLDWI